MGEIVIFSILSSINLRSELLQEVLSNVINSMREVDPLFKVFFQMCSPAGSSWEALKICCPNEFDINIILKFHQPSIKVK